MLVAGPGGAEPAGGARHRAGPRFVQRHQPHAGAGGDLVRERRAETSRVGADLGDDAGSGGDGLGPRGTPSTR
jgi:hypothetical protein